MAIEPRKPRKPRAAKAGATGGEATPPAAAAAEPSLPPEAPPPLEAETAPAAAASVKAAPEPSPRKVSATRRTAHMALPAAAIGAISLLANVAQGPSSTSPAAALTAPTPMVAGKAVSWWAAFKFSGAYAATTPSSPDRLCTFGGGVPKTYSTTFSQQYVFATSQSPSFTVGQGLIGVGPDDPVGATFAQVYQSHFHYVVWNDQLYGSPSVDHCGPTCGTYWGHSKGMLAWNDAGEGMVMQVSTPSWPGSGNASWPRQNDGDTLGCVNDNDLELSQHFFSLKLSKDDVVQVLAAMNTASVATDPTVPQLVNNGGPPDIQAAVQALGMKSSPMAPTMVTLSSGVTLISKPSHLLVPPWQLVSAKLGGVALRVATWWNPGFIPSTNAANASNVDCWAEGLGTAGPVENSPSGAWKGSSFDLQSSHNHAKLGISTSGPHRYAIFGDMNQEGALGPASACKSAQNVRGGMFFVVDNAALNESLGALIGQPASPDPPAR